jgi:hypothetical protein
MFGKGFLLVRHPEKLLAINRSTLLFLSCKDFAATSKGLKTTSLVWSYQFVKNLTSSADRTLPAYFASKPLFEDYRADPFQRMMDSFEIL